MILDGHGLRVELPAGWSGRVFAAPHGRRRCMRAAFQSALDETSTFGDRATGRMPAGGVVRGADRVPARGWTGAGRRAVRAVAVAATARPDRILQAQARASAARPGRDAALLHRSAQAVLPIRGDFGTARRRGANSWLGSTTCWGRCGSSRVERRGRAPRVPARRRRSGAIGLRRGSHDAARPASTASAGWQGRRRRSARRFAGPCSSAVSRLRRLGPALQPAL